MRSKGFRDWLSYRFYQAHKGAPSSQATQDALAALEAKARFEGEEHTPAVRIAHHGGNIYLDLADDVWQAIEITRRGWSVTAVAPVRFVLSTSATVTLPSIAELAFTDAVVIKGDLIAPALAALDGMVEFKNVCIRSGAALVAGAVREKNNVFCHWRILPEFWLSSASTGRYAFIGRVCSRIP